MFPRTGEAEAGRGEDARPAASAGPLAVLLGRHGEFKGKRFPIRIPVVNIGRAEYNDLVLQDSTVSTIHAKLQRREGIWTLVDLDSTNGTFVDGQRISSDTPLAPSAIVRFGDVSMIFQPTDDEAGLDQGASTKLMGAMTVPPKPFAGGGGATGGGGQPPSTPGDPGHDRRGNA